MARVPLSIQAIESSCCVGVAPHKKKRIYPAWIWILTFLVYTAYHMAKRPIAMVKNVLNQNCSELTPPPGTNPNDTHWCDWAPFDGDDAGTMFGQLDAAFLYSYAFGMFFSGMLAERVDLRLFLTGGMVLTGLFTAMFGMGYFFEIHSLWFYLLTQLLSGLAQCTGWPGVVTAMGNWFGKSKRGLIFGIWNCHTSVGNIVGGLIATAFMNDNWGLSFVVPGIITGCIGIIVLFFLVPTPSMVGLPNPNTLSQPEGVSPVLRRRQHDHYVVHSEDETAGLLHSEVEQENYVEKKEEISEVVVNPDTEKPVGFLSALAIPGVVEFSLCLFFSKLVSYTFLFWLPNYILNNTGYSPSESGNLAVFFDVGGMVGGIMAGIISDYSGMSALTCAVLLVLAIPSMYLYMLYLEVSMGVNIFLLVVCGLLVNGPYALITTAVSADLGTHESLLGNAKALATVTAIIDGTGSIGAALGPQIAGPLSEYSWDYVFYMLMVADVFALLLLTRLVVREVRRWLSQRNQSHQVL